MLSYYEPKFIEKCLWESVLVRLGDQWGEKRYVSYQIDIKYRVSKNDLYRVRKIYKKYKINTECNDNTSTVKIMMSILSFDNIIMMSPLVDLWHDMFEKNEILVFDFLLHDKIIALKSVGYSVPTTGAVKVLS